MLALFRFFWFFLYAIFDKLKLLRAAKFIVELVNIDLALQNVRLLLLALGVKSQDAFAENFITRLILKVRIKSAAEIVGVIESFKIFDLELDFVVIALLAKIDLGRAYFCREDWIRGVHRVDEERFQVGKFDLHLNLEVRFINATLVRQLFHVGTFQFLGSSLSL